MLSQLKFAQNLLRINPEEMNHSEFNLGLALLMKYKVNVVDNAVKAFIKDSWVDYDPMNNADQFLEILMNQPIVIGSHTKYSENGEIDGYWYSAHAFYGETKTEGYDYKEVIAESCIKLLDHKIKYSDEPYFQ